MAKRPAEVFGHPIDVQSSEATDHRNRHWCPYADAECEKKSRLTGGIPFGVCSVEWNGQVVALSPNRFLQNHLVFYDIADHCFQSRENLLLFSEIGVPSAGHLGRFDYVLVRHKPLSNKVEDFAVIEFQAGQTTSTGGLVKGFKDHMDGKDITRNTYAFGLNMADIWKRAFTQVLTKGLAMERWGRSIYWVVQEPVYRNFVARYGLQEMVSDVTPEDEPRTFFAVYDLKRSGDEFMLYKSREFEPATVDYLFHSFRTNFRIPDEEVFRAKLEHEIRARLQLTFDKDL